MAAGVFLLLGGVFGLLLFEGHATGRIRRDVRIPCLKPPPGARRVFTATLGRPPDADRARQSDAAP